MQERAENERKSENVTGKAGRRQEDYEPKDYQQSEGEKVLLDLAK